MHGAGDILNDRYRIVRLLGSGGSATVFLAEDLRLDKLWAVKVIDLTMGFGTYFADREIEILKSLSHPRFPRIIDAWADGELEYIVSDYIEGVSLAQLLTQGPLTKSRASGIAYQICDALKYLHNNDPPILYLDLKPDNILISSNGDVFLIDFGISTVIKNSYYVPFGTPGYAAPERYSGKAADCTDERADIFSFGVTYFVMRTSLAPQLICRADKLSNLSHREKIMISRCTAASPPNRYASVVKVINQLNRINYRFSFSIRIFILFAGLFALFIPLFILNHTPKTDEALTEMSCAISGYVTESGYTPEGLRIICNYINSGRLSVKDEQYYSFEVARDYFENYADYREAKRYFEKLDSSIYPEKEYYLCICNLQTGFDYDAGILRKCLAEFEKEISGSRDSRKKYENLLFVSFCYDAYLFDNDMARSIIDKGIACLAEMEENDTDEAWIKDMKTEYLRRREYFNG